MDLVVSGFLKLGLETVSDLRLAFSHDVLVRCATITDSMVAGIDPAVLSCLLYRFTKVYGLPIHEYALPVPVRLVPRPVSMINLLGHLAPAARPVAQCLPSSSALVEGAFRAPDDVKLPRPAHSAVIAAG